MNDENHKISDDRCYINACIDSIADPNWQPTREIFTDLLEVASYNLELIENTKKVENMKNVLDALYFYADPGNWWGFYVVDSKSPMYDDWDENLPERWDDGEFSDGKPGKKAREAFDAFFKIEE